MLLHNAMLQELCHNYQHDKKAFVWKQL